MFWKKIEQRFDNWFDGQNELVKALVGSSILLLLIFWYEFCWPIWLIIILITKIIEYVQKKIISKKERKINFL
jgi:MFS superfamily sulfate permease-like transporter